MLPRRAIVLLDPNREIEMFRRTSTPVLLLVAMVLAGCTAGGVPGSTRSGDHAHSSSARAVPSRGCAHPRAPVSELLLTVDGTPRRALVTVPAVHRPVPLILSFHGSGTSSELQVAVDQFSDPGRRPALVIRPSGLPLFEGVTGWNLDLGGDVDEVAFVRALLHRAEASYCVDLNRVYAAGISNGGGMAELLACSIPDKLAAVALVSPLSMSQPCAADAPVPLIAFRGVRDLILPYQGTQLGLTTTFGFEQWADEWADRNGCSPGRHYGRPRGRVQPLSWSGCTAPVEAFRLYGYGHTWPHKSKSSGDLAPEAFLSGCALAATQQFFQSIGLTCEEGIKNLFLSPTGYSATDEILRFFATNPRRHR